MIEKINGYKTYIAGIGLILSGAATTLTGVVTMINQLIPLTTLSDYYEFFKNIGGDPAAGVLVTGFTTLCAGLAAVGLKHSHEKLEVSVVTASTDAIVTTSTQPIPGSTRNP